jgi:nitrite reductase (NADH) large subunit
VDTVRRALADQEQVASLAARFEHARDTYAEAWGEALVDDQRKKFYAIEKR